MSKALTVQDSWVVRVLRALKLVGVAPDGQVEHSAGADFIPNHPSSPAYDPLSSLSSMAAFPWVYAAITALATDLSKVPVKVSRGLGKDAIPEPEHPVLALISQPSSRVNGVLFWRQVITDLTLTGDAFILMAGKGQPEALLRLHPSRVRIMPQPDGQPDAYEYHGGEKTIVYEYTQLLHIRTPSWADDPRSLWGVGAIQSLHQDLVTDRRTQELTAASAATGRPTGIISPSEEGDRWSHEQIKVLREAYEKQMSSGSGLLVMGGALDYTPVGWSPKDMEFSQVRNMTREAVLAALDVPPTRVGLPSANYATSKEQAKRYWEGLQGRAALIDTELTRLAQLFPDSEDVYVQHDFSGVEALQESRTDRLNRVLTWVNLGVPIAEAAAYEGFDDLPTENIVDPYESLVGEEQPEDEPEDEADKNYYDIAKWLTVSKVGDEDEDEQLIKACTDVTCKDARAEYMRDFVYEFHLPYERAMNTLMKRYLRGQGARIAKRVREVLPEKKSMRSVITRQDLSETFLRQIMNDASERKIFSKDLKPLIEKMVRRAVKQAMRNAQQTGQVITPEWIQNEAQKIMADLSENVYKMTEKEVLKTIEAGLEEDKPIGWMQEQLMKNHAFSPQRALRIARTETTKTVNSATRKTYEEIANRGIDMEMIWLSAPGARDSHAALDGETAEPGGQFTIPPDGGKHAGKQAPHPGGFGEGGLDINCRCTIAAKVKR